MNAIPTHSGWFRLSRRGHEADPTPDQMLARVVYEYRMTGAKLLLVEPAGAMEWRLRVGWEGKTAPGTDRGPIPA